MTTKNEERADGETKNVGTAKKKDEPTARKALVVATQARFPRD